MSTNFTLHLGDCLDPVTGMASLPDKSVDVAIFDPPYSEHVDKNSVRGRGHRPGGVLLPDLGFRPLDLGMMRAISDQLARLVRRWVLTFCAAEQTHEWRDALTAPGLEYVREGVWVKINGTPQFTGDRPGVAHEPFVIAHQPGAKRWNGGGRPALYSETTAYRASEATGHPTQKPLALMQALVRDFSDPGELILDPFAGSGTTGVAALGLGRRFVGWEQNAEWHAGAAKRIAATREQMDLFRRRAKQPKAKQGALALGGDDA